MNVLTLLSDYGLKGPFVAEIKGLILKINPKVTIVDITHDLGNHEILECALNLARSAPFFPDETVHIVFTNPDISVDSQPIIIQTENAWLVGFDNGILAPAAERLGVKEVYRIEVNSKLLPHRESDTFLGRDVLAPVGALLATGISPSKIGKRISGFHHISDFNPKINNNRIESKVIHIDNFGNLVTNVTSDDLKKMSINEEHTFILNVDNQEIKIPFVRNYSCVEKDRLLFCLCGGYLELAVYLGSAQKTTGLKVGDKFNILFK